MFLWGLERWPTVESTCCSNNGPVFHSQWPHGTSKVGKSVEKADEGLPGTGGSSASGVPFLAAQHHECSEIPLKEML